MVFLNFTPFHSAHFRKPFLNNPFYCTKVNLKVSDSHPYIHYLKLNSKMHFSKKNFKKKKKISKKKFQKKKKISKKKISKKKNFKKKISKKKISKKKKKFQKKKFQKKISKIMIPKISQNFTVMNSNRTVKISNMKFIFNHQFISSIQQ